MQIGNQPGASPSTSIGAHSTRVGAVEEPLELQLEELTPQQRSEVRNYLAGVSEGIDDLQGLSPNKIEGFDQRDHERMQDGYRALSDGGNIFKLLHQRPEIADKINKFVIENKGKDKLQPPSPEPVPGGKIEEPARIFLDAFDRWDTNRDGGLDRAELGRAFQDTNMTPEEGAAFSAIYERCMFPRKDAENPQNNEPDLLEDGKVTREEVQSITGKTGSYQNALNKINGSPDQAFVGPPDGDAVVQGRHGSCAFLAALIAMAENDPAAVQRMIKDNGDGSWQVTFPGKEPVRVTLSAAERARGASGDAQGGNNGLWVAILEKAYAIVQAGPESTDPLYDVYHDGEDIERTSETLSGQDAEKIPLGFDTGGLAGPLMAASVRARIAQSLLDGRPVTCALFDKNNPWQLPTGHAYTVLNLRGDNLTLRNPWGGGEGNTSDGQEDGRITVSLNDFIRYFSDLSV